MADFLGARSQLRVGSEYYNYYRLSSLEAQNFINLSTVPYSLRILIESMLRGCENGFISREQVLNLLSWKPKDHHRPSIPFNPARVVMQDFTGVPAVVDLGAMRSAIARLDGDPSKVNPQIKVDLVIDHSVQVDHSASINALQRNTAIEFSRNAERYEFLRWGQDAFSNFRVIPPSTGIVHQVNLEYLAEVVMTSTDPSGKPILYPDTLVGTDSHTTMINGLGVLGWGVGGIEAEAVMLGQPYDMLTPDVVGVRLTGARRPGVTATDLALTIVEHLRNYGVVGKFVEFTGSGLDSMSLPDRATISNMAPEYGATIGFFPVDDETLRYLKVSGRSDHQVALIENYCKEQGLFRTQEAPEPQYSSVIDLDMDTIEPAIAGPKRPQDRVALGNVASSFRNSLLKSKSQRGFELIEKHIENQVTVKSNGHSSKIGHGAVVIAAITSCTNTSNPSVMLGAGILAKKAIEQGLSVSPYVKTSLAPGSTVVADYLQRAGLLEPLAALGFNIVGYGCTTCIGNSGPLPMVVTDAIDDGDLVVASVLSGNRNFEGRIHAKVKANFLASPPLVIAYAIAGSIRHDLTTEPLGTSSDGKPVYLSEIWPNDDEISATVRACVRPEMFRQRYNNVNKGNDSWNSISIGSDTNKKLYAWDKRSTYVQEPPFFTELTPVIPSIKPIKRARILAMLGDSVTTDHISPAGTIPLDSPAGRYLREQGISLEDFNSYGARRGNHEVLMRGTFANIRLKNSLAAGGREGGYTTHFPSGKSFAIYDAAVRYRSEGVPLIVLGGREYGAGSSRDWAAKGPLLLGVRAVIVESFEHIHRSNLVAMGVLPLQFMEGSSASSLGLTGKELFSIDSLSNDIQPGEVLTVQVMDDGGAELMTFPVIVRIDTDSEVDYYRHGGILNMVLRNMLR